VTIHLSEREVMRQVADYLLARRILFFRMQTGAHLAGGVGRQRLIRYGVTGMADLQAYPRVPLGFGKFLFPTADNGKQELITGPLPLWIECKSSSGKQRPEQISFQKIVEDNGHGYILARSYEDVEAWLKARGL
jgi:hypothetical protein